MKKHSSRFTIKVALNGSQETTHNSTNKKEIVPEINDNEEIPEVNFLIHLKLIKISMDRTQPNG